MAVDLQLTPKVKRPAGERCCEPEVYPDVEREQAVRMAEVAKALGDPVRLAPVDVLRKHAGKVCVCELVPLFDLSSRPSPTTSRSCARPGSSVLREGLWAYYVMPDALEELSRWLT
jgi:ArsR family transcriptional regulator, arsenate/arsenite/antimonite-responsive transcriptional repressor